MAEPGAQQASVRGELLTTLVEPVVEEVVDMAVERRRGGDERDWEGSREKSGEIPMDEQIGYVMLWSVTCGGR